MARSEDITHSLGLQRPIREEGSCSGKQVQSVVDTVDGQGASMRPCDAIMVNMVSASKSLCQSAHIVTARPSSHRASLSVHATHTYEPCNAPEIGGIQSEVPNPVCRTMDHGGHCRRPSPENYAPCQPSGGFLEPHSCTVIYPLFDPGSDV